MANCIGCGHTLVRRDGESEIKFAARDVCGPRCLSLFNQTRPDADVIDRHCPACGARLVRKRRGNKRETTTAFMARQTCGYTCKGVIHRSDQRTAKPCEECGAMMFRELSHWTKRRYCSHRCAKIAIARERRKDGNAAMVGFVLANASAAARRNALRAAEAVRAVVKS